MSVRLIVKLGKRTAPNLGVDILSKAIQTFPFKLLSRFYESSGIKRLCEEQVQLKRISLSHQHFTKVFLLSLNSEKPKQLTLLDIC